MPTYFLSQGKSHSVSGPKFHTWLEKKISDLRARMLLEVSLTLEILGLRSVTVTNPGLAEGYAMLQSTFPLDQNSSLNLAVKTFSEL